MKFQLAYMFLLIIYGTTTSKITLDFFYGNCEILLVIIMHKINSYVVIIKVILRIYLIILMPECAGSIYNAFTTYFTAYAVWIF